MKVFVFLQCKDCRKQGKKHKREGNNINQRGENGAVRDRQKRMEVGIGISEKNYMKNTCLNPKMEPLFCVSLIDYNILLGVA